MNEMTRKILAPSPNNYPSKLGRFRRGGGGSSRICWVTQLWWLWVWDGMRYAPFIAIFLIFFFALCHILVQS